MIQQLGSSSATWVNRWEVSSLTSDKTYIVGQKSDGSFGCDCPAWKFKKAPRPDCKHILKVRAVEPVDDSKKPTARDFQAARTELAHNRTATSIQAMRKEVACREATAPSAHTTTGPVFLLQTRRSIRRED